MRCYFKGSTGWTVYRLSDSHSLVPAALALTAKHCCQCLALQPQPPIPLPSSERGSREVNGPEPGDNGAREQLLHGRFSSPSPLCLPTPMGGRWNQGWRVRMLVMESQGVPAIATSAPPETSSISSSVAWQESCGYRQLWQF